MIAIISGCGANIASVQFALERLGKQSILTTDPSVITSAQHVILPGVGAAQQAMAQLQKLNLLDVIRNIKRPLLGICLGMQVLYESSEEGQVNCLGVLSGKITALPAMPNLTIPHMGWNQLQKVTASPLLEGIDDDSYVYFVHSYAAPVNSHTLACAQYGVKFAAVVQNKNFYGVQFHPERSGKMGAKILENFLNLE